MGHGSRIIVLVAHVLVLISCGSSSSEENVPSTSYRLFRATDVWELADATYHQDTAAMSALVTGDQMDVNAVEPRFGETILMLSVRRGDLITTKHLLQLGADPNLTARFQGSTALTYAADLEAVNPKAVEIIRLLLSNGADPNLPEGCEDIVERCIARSPLIAVCSDNTGGIFLIDEVAALVEAGADVNYRDWTKMSALQASIIFEHFNAALYLIEHGADYRSPLDSKSDNPRYLVDYLRSSMVELGSERHKQKKVLIAALRALGVDYERTEVPEYVLKKAKEFYPSSWEEYIREY